MDGAHRPLLGPRRGYGDLGPLEVAATADVVALMGNDGVAIIDYKTGHSRIAPAGRNWQLLFLALCAARRWGRYPIDWAAG